MKNLKDTLKSFFNTSGICTFFNVKVSLRYFLNKMIRRLIMKIMYLARGKSEVEQRNFKKERIEKILLVRTSFRMGNSILATPAVFLFRNNFPHARIDFVGSPISKALFQNLPIDHHFSITRCFPGALWDNLILLKKIRSAGYDMAVDATCSQSSMSSIIVGLSGARFRIGSKGRWDHWFNITIPRPAEKNKYHVLPLFFTSIGIETQKIFPLLILSPVEKEEGRKRMETLVGGNNAPVIGIFVGGRKEKRKRWPVENFLQLITALREQGIKSVVFFGPEERQLIKPFRQALGDDTPFVFEPSVRLFASMISHCDLFIACDSGPVHLACALGVRSVVIFQKQNYKHWGPPETMAKIIYEQGGVSVESVLKTLLLELSSKGFKKNEFCLPG